MKSVGAKGHVSQLVAQRIVIAKIVKDYDHYKPNPRDKVILFLQGSRWDSTFSILNRNGEGK